MKSLIKRKVNLFLLLFLMLVLFIASIDMQSISAEVKNDNYNRELAREYAIKWATSSNSKYYNYVNDGGDCTNFVSQVLRAGGMEFVGDKSTATSIKSWFYYSPNLPNRSSTWTAAQPFHLHFGEEYKRVHSYKEYKIIEALVNWDEIYLNLLPGDIVQYSRPNNITFHSQAITDLIDKNKTIYFCQHSNSMENFKKNGNLRYYLMGKPNDYNFYIYQIKDDNQRTSIEVIANNKDNKSNEDYRKELIEAIDIIKLSLDDTRVDNEELNSKETNDFIKKMENRIKEVEFHMNSRGKTPKELLEILCDREGL
ncbi:amidase domain-containing protein [Clostridium sp. DSM 100503]|uniref:amidase domain-containing protein n=1 Tax=Clostridium sp. DSM 100503 TaxID=2963282 RepID=UPI002149D8BC|nr:amidase domain-containing protein [Clostridium sp. DSM 100503]MCR1950749.1 amidase domain-containing protein [Clostridium sp. DSM 100503]